eukprot:SAG11_NODE_1708_length_4407_cov_6.993036_7_plen_63_part_00
MRECAAPVPQGERSIMPVWVSGLSQSSTPFVITTALREVAPEPLEAGPRNTILSTPGYSNSG